MPRKRQHSNSDEESSADDPSNNSQSDEDSDLKTATKKKKKQPPKKISSDSNSSDDDDGDDGEWNAKPTKSKPKKSNRGNKKFGKKKLKAASSDSDNRNDEQTENVTEEREEGEVDFSDDDNEVFNDGFDDNLMGDEEDQRKLAQMTEKEREQELFNRSEKREVLRTRFEIERKLRLAKKQEMKKKTNDSCSSNNKNSSNNNNNNNNVSINNNPGTSGINNVDISMYSDSATRSIERRRNLEDKRKVKDAMKGLKAEREKKKEKLKQKLKTTDVYSDSDDSDESTTDIRNNKKGVKKSSTSDEYSSSSGSDDSDDAGDGKGGKSSLRKRNDSDWDMERPDQCDYGEEQFDFNIEHLNSIRISRHKMEKWCHSPFFKDTVMNAFVRIGIGSSVGSALPQYLVGQIIDVLETPKVYNLGETRTNKGVKLRHANNPERVYRLEFVSNSEFTLPEFEEWSNKMISEKCDFPTRELVERKKKDIQTALNYNYSDKDIEMIVMEKQRFKNKPINFAMKKTQLLKEKEFYEMHGDHEKAQEITKEIDKLEEESKQLEKVRTQSIASISFINERNRLKNIKEAERAMAEAAKEAQKNPNDPFTRRKCTPSMIHVFNKKKLNNLNDEQKDDSVVNNENCTNDNGQSQQQQNENGHESESVTATENSISNINNKNESKNTNGNSTVVANDMFSVHDFDIKIDFENLDLTNTSTLSQQSSNFLTNFSNSKPNGFHISRSNQMQNSATNRRSLNLDEYKKKKGLI